MTIEFSVLGPLEVTGPDGRVRITGLRERAALAALVVWAGEVVSTDRLIDAIWNDRPPRSSVHVVRNLVLRLRKTLGSELIATRPEGYVLCADPDAVDVHRFERLVREGRALASAGEWEHAAGTLAAACDLWRGPPLGELADWPLARAEAARLEEARRCAREELAEAELACGRHREWVAPLEAMVTDEPFRERLWALFALGLYRSGRQVEALRAFQRARAALAELGLEPGTDLCSLEQRISARDPSLDLKRRSGRARHNLPSALTRFIGRHPELEELEDLLAASRLVTLTGVGGTGKTRLALEAAGRALDQSPDGVWLVELAPLREDAAVSFSLAAACGMLAGGSDGTESVEELLCSYLATRHALVVLDNCEHLVGAAARLAHTLLRRCPGVRILATSRETLALPGEVVLPVAPLSLPRGDALETNEVLMSDAVTLFYERARDAQPPFRLTPANIGTVARICRRLDGIPLALELAAARVRMLSVDQIAVRLDDCLGLLTSGLRTDELRHQTMRASLDWSYDLLPPREQAALRQLSIFPDSFELGAALAVLATGATAGIDTVSRLVDKSLVVVHSESDEVRYRLLEPVRQYADEKLADAGETKIARDRLCAFLLSLTDTWIGSVLSAEKLRRVAADQRNFRAALAWSWSDGNIEAALRLVGAMSASWTWRGDLQGREWMELVLAEPEPRDHRARVQVLSNLPLMLHDLGEFERADALMSDAAEMAHRLNDFEAMAKVDVSFGELELARGKTADARLYFERGLSTYESLGYAEGAGWTHHDLGWLALAEHDPDRALSHFERASDLAQTFDGGEWLSTHARLALAPLVVAAGDREQGVCLAENALRDGRSLPDDAVLLMALTRTAETSILAADYARAGELVEELLELLHDLGTRRWVAGALEMSALVLESRGDHAAATEILGASDGLREVSGSAATQGVDSCRERLTVALGRDCFTDHAAGGRRLSVERAVRTARARLEIRA